MTLVRNAVTLFIWAFVLFGEVYPGCSEAISVGNGNDITSARNAKPAESSTSGLASYVKPEEAVPGNSSGIESGMHNKLLSESDSQTEFAGASPVSEKAGRLTLPGDDVHHMLYKRLRAKGATADEVMSVRSLHNTIKALKEQEQQMHQQLAGLSNSDEADKSDTNKEEISTVARQKRDAMHALKEIMRKYNVMPTLQKPKGAQSQSSKPGGSKGRHSDVAELVELRQQYLHAQTHDEREKVSVECSILLADLDSEYVSG